MTDNPTARTYPLPFGERANLDYRADWGSTTLLPVQAGEEPRLEVRGRDAGRVQVDVSRVGDAVRVQVSKSGGPRPFGRLDAEMTLFVPREIGGRAHADVGRVQARDLGPCDLRLGTDAGSVRASAITGRLWLQSDAGSVEARNLAPCDLTVRSEAGSVRLENVRGKIDLASEAGQIAGDRLAGSISARTEAGAIKLAIEALEPGDHQFGTKLGSVRLALAPGLNVRIEARASLGSAKVRYPSNPGAPTALLLRTDVGSIRVHEAGTEDEMQVRIRHGHRRGREEMFASHGPWTHGGDMPRRPVAAEAAPPRPASQVSAELERILKLVEAGELSAQDADELLRALERE